MLSFSGASSALLEGAALPARPGEGKEQAGAPHAAVGEGQGLTGARLSVLSFVGEEWHSCLEGPVVARPSRDTRHGWVETQAAGGRAGLVSERRADVRCARRCGATPAACALSGDCSAETTIT